MKNLLAILLALTLTFTCTACLNEENNDSGADNSGTTSTDTQNNGGDNSTSASLGVNESEWNAAIQSQKFDNVTFTYNATFTSGYDEVGPHKGTFELVENGMLMDGKPTSAEERTAAKTMFVDTAVAIVNNFSMFEYDKENNHYSSKENIVFNTTILGYEATITAENVLVVLDADNNIAKISCKMTQKFQGDGGNLTTYVLDTEFTFSNYGTTTIE